MPTGLGTAALIAGLAGAGASIFGAKKGSDAAKTAAEQEAAAGAKALDFQKQVYGDTESRLNPYVTAGQQSLQNLMAQHWGTGGQPGDSARLSAAANTFTPGAPGSAFEPGPRGVPMVNMNRVPPQGMPQPGMSLAQMQGQGGPMQQPGGGGMQEQGPEGPAMGMVGVRAPDGEVRYMSESDAQRAIAQGAQRL